MGALLAAGIMVIAAGLRNALLVTVKNRNQRQLVENGGAFFYLRCDASLAVAALGALLVLGAVIWFATGG